MTTDACD